MGATISIDYVSHHYRGSRGLALENIDARIEPGEIVALIGRSGCGKSTLLHVIAGLLKSSNGCVRIDGRTVNKPSAKWNMMFQKPSLYPWMSVEKNVALGLSFAGKKAAEIEPKVASLLSMVGLIDKCKDNVQALSGGQQQRVALARSLATEPDLLLLDEPFSALDKFTRSDLQNQVCDIAHNLGITVVLVTHDIEEAIATASRVLIMAPNPGRIVDEMPVKLAYPRSRDNKEWQDHLKELNRRFNKTAADIKLIKSDKQAESSDELNSSLG